MEPPTEEDVRSALDEVFYNLAAPKDATTYFAMTEWKRFKTSSKKVINYVSFSAYDAVARIG